MSEQEKPAGAADPLDLVERLRRRTFRPTRDMVQAFNEQGNLTAGDSLLHEQAAEEIERLRNEVHELQQGAELLLAANDKLMKSMDAVVDAQRERCAKLCDALVDPGAKYGEAEYSAGAAECARRIRAA